MDRHDDGGSPDGTPSAGHSTVPQRDDTGDEEAASCRLTEKNEHEASRGL